MVSGNSLPVPEKLEINDLNKGKNWRLFKQSWKYYEDATGLCTKPNKQRLATLLTIIGKDGLELYNTFKFNEEDRTIEDVIQAFDKYCEPITNLTFERYKFLSRKQNTGESVDSYMTALHSLVSTCEYGTMQDEMIKDALVLGIIQFY